VRRPTRLLPNRRLLLNGAHVPVPRPKVRGAVRAAEGLSNRLRAFCKTNDRSSSNSSTSRPTSPGVSESAGSPATLLLSHPGHCLARDAAGAPDAAQTAALVLAA
jgi:hypothetical protein